MTQAGLHDALAAHRPFLWALCYRMCGVPADADDLVQDTFARALQSPPQGELRPYLARIAVNAARDLLRARKRHGYGGTWLPGPHEGDGDEPPAHEPMIHGESAEGRYELWESASFAFLLALETLTPRARAVLLLRDVFDYSAQEAASALGMSEANVRTTHHRARKVMEANYRRRPRAAAGRTRAALQALLGAVMSQDVKAVEALLAQDVEALADGGGEFYASRVPVRGAARVAQFLVRLLQLRGAPSAAELRMVNGEPALVARFDDGRPHEAPRSVLRIELDEEGRIRALHNVLATRKLSAIRF